MWAAQSSVLKHQKPPQSIQNCWTALKYIEKRIVNGFSMVARSYSTFQYFFFFWFGTTSTEFPIDTHFGWDKNLFFFSLFNVYQSAESHQYVFCASRLPPSFRRWIAYLNEYMMLLKHCLLLFHLCGIKIGILSTVTQWCTFVFCIWFRKGCAATDIVYKYKKSQRLALGLVLIYFAVMRKWINEKTFFF